MNEEEAWRPAITIKEILIGVQDLLDDPNPESPAQAEAYNLFKKDRAAYEKKVRQIVRENPAPWTAKGGSNNEIYYYCLNNDSRFASFKAIPLRFWSLGESW